MRLSHAPNAGAAPAFDDRSGEPFLEFSRSVDRPAKACGDGPRRQTLECRMHPRPSTDLCTICVEPNQHPGESRGASELADYLRIPGARAQGMDARAKVSAQYRVARQSRQCIRSFVRFLHYVRDREPASHRYPMGQALQTLWLLRGRFPQRPRATH